MQVDNFNSCFFVVWSNKTKHDMHAETNFGMHIFIGVVLRFDYLEQVTIRTKLVMAIFDLPPKAAATNTKLHNGEFVCFYCLDKGKYYN